jgi:hypothetical protein
MRKAIPGFVLFLGLVAFGATGCGSKFSDYCKTLQTCGGGNDQDVEACEDTAEAALNSADDYGCGDVASNLSECLNQSITCSAQDACDTQSAAVDACVCAASATCKKGGASVTGAPGPGGG